MRHIIFGVNADKFKTAILIKDASFIKDRLVHYYIRPLLEAGCNINDFIGFTLDYGGAKKPSAKTRKEYLDELLPALVELGVSTLYVADGEYFKTLTNSKKADPFYGYVLDCVIPGFEHLKVILGTNHHALGFNPNLQVKLNLSIKTLFAHMTQSYTDPGTDIIHDAYYLHSPNLIRAALQNLHQYDELTCDIEGFSLKFYDCGVGTISFAWDEHHGIAINVDCVSIEPTEIQVWDKKDKKFKTKIAHIEKGFNTEVRALIKQFLCEYKGKLTYHNGGFDMKVLTYQLWMKDLGDYAGMLEGIEILCRDFDDSKLIAYLATNNTAKNELSLKVLAQVFAGNYGKEEINDIRLIPLPELLQYNLVDCLSTHFVKKKYYPIMVADNQLEIYLSIFKPSVKVIIQMELVGMPIDPEKVQEAKVILQDIVDGHTDYLMNSNVIKEFHYQQMMQKVDADNLKLKKKVRTIEEFDHIKFNPGSDDQVTALIYDFLGYEVIDTTKSGGPAVGGKTLDKLINHSRNAEHREIFKNLIGLSKANKILTSFIPAFEQAQQLPDGSWRLYGNFNLGGTQSGRLSSSGPNMQNIPSGSKYAKIIKMCFVSPPGWLFVGADFKALEAVGEALLSKDPNKLKVYIEGYDSHCVNTYAYFSHELPDIVAAYESATDSATKVAVINSIEVKYKPKRQKSKSPTFALQYQGTWRTIMKSAGLPEEESKLIEHNYHALYVISDAWIKGVLDEAHVTGFITTAFGLRIRTPILAQTPLDSKRMPYAAMAERRSAGNAKTQGYGMLNSRAGIEMQERVLASPHRLDIMPCAQIHDAGYMLVRNKPSVVTWTNTNFIECMCWNKLPELQHDIVKLGAELEIYHPDWASAVKIPNRASKAEIVTIAKAHVKEMQLKKAA